MAGTITLRKASGAGDQSGKQWGTPAELAIYEAMRQGRWFGLWFPRDADPDDASYMGLWRSRVRRNGAIPRFYPFRSARSPWKMPVSGQPGKFLIRTGRDVTAPTSLSAQHTQLRPINIDLPAGDFRLTVVAAIDTPGAQCCLMSGNDGTSRWAVVFTSGGNARLYTNYSTAFVQSAAGLNDQAEYAWTLERTGSTTRLLKNGTPVPILSTTTTLAAGTDTGIRIGSVAGPNDNDVVSLPAAMSVRMISLSANGSDLYALEKAIILQENPALVMAA